MKTFVRLFTLVAAIGFSPAVAMYGQPAPKLAVVDLGKVYDAHYKTEEQNIKLRGDLQKAQLELERINTEGNALVEEYKQLAEQAKNPALTVDAKAKVERDANAKLELIQRKEGERENFTGTVDQRREEQVKTFRDALIAEISKLGSDIAKKRGANLLVDRSGPSLFGVSNIMYVDPAYDISDELLAEINKGRPASPSVTPPLPASKAASPTPSNAAPVITVPGVPAKK